MPGIKGPWCTTTTPIPTSARDSPSPLTPPPSTCPWLQSKEYVHLEGKWEGWLFFHVKLNLTDPCPTICASTTVEGCQAGGLGHLFQYMREYIAESAKQDSIRFNSIEKTIGFGHLVFIYLWSAFFRGFDYFLGKKPKKRRFWLSAVS